MQSFLEGNFARYQEIKHLREGRVRRTSTGYAHVVYAVVVDDETRQLSNKDLVILCDEGNACFGGKVRSRSGEEATVEVYTD